MRTLLLALGVLLFVLFTDSGAQGPVMDVTLGGGGGNPFSPVLIKSIAVRHGNKVDAIIINGVRRGGGGGNQSPTLDLADGEYINKIVIRHGNKIDYVAIYTNRGRVTGGGAGGGRETTLEGRIVRIGGRSGNRLDRLEVHGQFKYQAQNFGGTGGNQFSAVPFKTIAIRHGNKVDAIIIDGVRHGGGGGNQSPTLSLADGEYINKMVIGHGNKIDNLTIHTNRGRSIGGGGGGGTRTIIKGRIVRIGGRSGNTLDGLQIMGHLVPSVDDINVYPSMDLIRSLDFENKVRQVSFDKNGFPLDYHSIFGKRWQHLQDMTRLPDANGKQYYMGTFSQNVASDEGGMVFVGEVATGNSGRVIWMDELNNSHNAGGYNHPGDIRRIGNIVIIAGQNWAGTAVSDVGVAVGGDDMDRGRGNYQNILFYDVSKPAEPRYIGKLNSCLDKNGQSIKGGKSDGEIDALSAVKLGEYYYLSFNGITCRSKMFYPHTEWEKVEHDNNFSSPVLFPLNGKSVVGRAALVEVPKNYSVRYDRATFGPGKKADPTKPDAKSSTLPINRLPDGTTFSLSSFPNGKSYIVFANVESDDHIGIWEIEGKDNSKIKP